MKGVDKKGKRRAQGKRKEGKGRPK